MLVLSRKIGEEVIIGENVRVRVLSIQGNQVRLGFVAPRTVQIHRQELLVEIQPSKPAPPQPDIILPAD
jgi:carbon storage regulator